MTGTTAAAAPKGATSSTTGTSEASPQPFSRLPIGHGVVLRAIQQNTVRVVLPVLGEIRLPSRDTLAWLGVLDWPATLAIGAGHVLAHQQHLRLLKDFGEGLEEA